MKNFLKVLTLIACAGFVAAQSKFSPDLPVWSAAPGSSSPVGGSQPITPTSQIDVIVQYQTPPSKNELKQLGPYGQIKKQFVHVNAVSASLTTGQIQTIATDTNVKYITPNRPTKGSLDVTTATVNANLAWSLGYTGTGIGVAVIDSGVYAHDDLKTADGTGSRVVFSESFVPGLDASDQYGHGTHVAGIVGSNGADSTGPGFKRTLKGVAPNVNLISFRVLDANGAGSDAGVIAAIDEAINLRTKYNIRVINLSLGRPVWESYTLDPLCQAVEAAWKAGIVVVAAAGNYGRDNSVGEHGYGTIVAPGNDPYVITVGAMNAMGTSYRGDDIVASYSSKGPTAIDHIVKPDLVAPGNGVASLMAPNCTLAATLSNSLVPNSYYKTGGTGTSNTYFRMSGTSMATPVVSGAVALLLQQDPTLTPDQVKAVLMKTAQKGLPKYAMTFDRITNRSFNLQSDVFAVGAGYLDIGAALYNHDRTTMPALSAVATYNSLTHHVSISRGLTTTWGSSVVWGDGLVYGLDMFSGLDAGGFSVVWGDSVIWGLDEGGGGFSVVWGDSVLLPMDMQALDVGDDDFSVVWGD
jgi:serine protease AprX